MTVDGLGKDEDLVRVTEEGEIMKGARGAA
jgi:hypothetical protein